MRAAVHERQQFSFRGKSVLITGASSGIGRTLAYEFECLLDAILHIGGQRPVRCADFFPIGWPQLDAVYEHGLAYARSSAFYDTTLVWQRMRPFDLCFRPFTLNEWAPDVSAA